MSCKGKVKKLIDKATLLKTQNEELTASNTELTETVETLTADNETLQNANSELETRVDELTASIKPEQEKSVDITENGTTEVTPDEGKTLSKVIVNVDVPSSGGTEELEAIIDASGVLGTTDGTVEDKVEQLVDKAKIEKYIYDASLKKGNCQYEFQYYTGKKLPLTNYTKCQHFNYFVADSSIETVDYYLDWNNNYKVGALLNSAFEGTQNLKTMVGINTKYAISVSSLFHNSGIVSIQEPFDFSNINSSSNMSAFTTAKKLVDVRIVPETWKWGTSIASGVLSNESIKSIVNGLATVETMQTLAVHSTVFQKFIDDEEISPYFDMAVEKNWSIE